MKIGLCVLGCGNFAKTFSESIQPLLTNIDLYFASRDLGKAEQYRQTFNGIGAFGSYSEAVTSPHVHAIYICTPHHLHLEHSILAANAGKHILIEKPIARTLDEGRHIVSISDKSKVNLMVAENYRFMPAIRLTKQLLDQGAIGKLRVIQIQQESAYLPIEWRQLKELNGGGVFIDAGIHKVHFLRYLLGEPSVIYAATSKIGINRNQGEDGLVFTSKWDSGEIGLIYHSWTASQPKSSHWISLSGTEGSIYLEIGKPLLHLYKGSEHQTFDIAGELNGILPMAEEFINSILEKRTPEISGEEGLADLNLIRIAYESANDKKAILNTSPL